MSKPHRAANIVAAALLFALSAGIVSAEPIIKFVDINNSTGPREATGNWRNPTSARVEVFQFNQYLDMIDAAQDQFSLIRYLQPAAAPRQPLPADAPQPLPPTENSAEIPENSRDIPGEMDAGGESAENIDPEFTPIGALHVNIRPTDGPLPADVAASRFEREGDTFHDTGYSRLWGLNNFEWVAPANAHRPLYFEDENLERYGYHWGLLQPAVSGAHFFARIPAIPYMRGAWPPREKIYSLGYYRPGSAAPFYVSRPPASLRGAALEAAAVSGGVLLVP